MATTDSNNSMLVAIVAIVAIFVVVYIGLMMFNKLPADTTGGTTAGVNLSVGNNPPPPPPNAQ